MSRDLRIKDVVIVLVVIAIFALSMSAASCVTCDTTTSALGSWSFDHEAFLNIWKWF